MSRLTGLEQELRRNLARFGIAAKGRVDVRAVVEGVLNLVSQTPRLQECTTTSIVEAVHKAVSLGLDPTGTTDEGYITPRKRHAVFVPGYRGLLKIAYENPRVGLIEAHVVRERDHFELRYGDPEGHVVDHRPRLNVAEGEPNVPIGAYAICWWRDCPQPLVEWMTAEEIEANAERSGNRDEDSPWQTDWPEMARKTVLKRLLKYIPLGPQLGVILRERDDDGSLEETETSDVGVADGDSGPNYDALIGQAATLEAIDQVIASLKADEALNSEEKTRLFNLAVKKKRELRAVSV
ncbi:MAG: recombinase RecT [Chloroflexi bacterium]|nr:recombinase RecT [Chloroflexota bacterium]